MNLDFLPKKNVHFFSEKARIKFFFSNEQKKVLKDGVGNLGTILFASRFGNRFDADAKRNKWRGDILHNVGTMVGIFSLIT